VARDRSRDAGAFAKRKVQWQRAHAIARQLRQGGAAAVVILGDANSAGYLSDDNGERAFVDAAARGAGMSVVTGELGCSEYWKQSEGVYSPSLLDQAVATEGVVKRGSARVHGYCEALGCKAYRGKGAPEGWERVSDHCPVTIEMSQ
jgi:hypothetical protein